MEPIAQQLDAVRRRARSLLIARRVFQFAMVAAPSAVALGLVDYLLRLPGWLRLVAGLALLIVAGGWLLGRLGRARAFAPSLADLALRAERMFPDLHGLLASGLELSTAGGSLDNAGPVSAGLSSATVHEAQRRAAGRNFQKLIDPRSTRKFAGAALLGVLLLGGVVLASPASAKIAAQRWLLPLGDTAWPRRVAVEAVDPPAVIAADTPVDLGAAVTRGHAAGMRVWLRYHFEHESSDGSAPWRSASTSVLMSPQNQEQPGENQSESSVARFSAQIETPAELVRRLAEQSANGPAGGHLVYRVEADDDLTDQARIPVVARPALRSVSVTVTPPAYARPYLATQQLDLETGTDRLGTIHALTGAQVAIHLAFNKPLSSDTAVARTWIAGLPDTATLRTANDSPATSFSDTLTIHLPADDHANLSILVEDAHGLTDTSPRQLRLVTTPDAPPTATVFEPATDQSVLPTAVIPVHAQANDDVSLTRLVVQAIHPDHDPQTQEKKPAAHTATLADTEQLGGELETSLEMEIAALSVRPGDVVELSALAWDVYATGSEAREPARSIIRRLTIIDAATLMSEVQRELAAVRRAAERLRAEQATLRRSEPPALSDLASPQSRITRGMRPPAQRLAGVARRLQQNHLAEPELDALIQHAQELLDDAEDASENARKTFENPNDPDEAQGRAQQEQAEEKLTALAELLDQGGDALGLRLEVAALRAEQEHLALDTRQLLPQTAGKSLEELADAQRDAVERLAQRQEELADQAEELVRRLASTAEALAQQSDRDADQAAAEALAQAADTARRQGLSQTMKGSAGDAQKNQLSQSGQQQLDALDTLDRMLEQIGQQDQKRRERLQRRLRKLAERIERLIRDQRVALQRLEAAVEDQSAIPALAEPEAALWQRIIAVQTEAEETPETADVAPILGEAASESAAAVAALRKADAPDATLRETATIEALERALEAVREAQKKQQEDNADRERAKLRQAYLDLADKQDELTGKTTPVLDKPRLNRRDRATLRTFAGEQTGVGDEALQLKTQVKGQLVFEHMHGRIEAIVSRAVEALHTSQNTQRVALDQAQIALTLRAMADALTPPPPNNDFQGSGSGSGSGGGGGGQGEMIPPAAQLKLLRAEQSILLQETRVAAEQFGDKPATDAAREAVDDLARRQRELAGLAKRLKEQLEKETPR